MFRIRKFTPIASALLLLDALASAQNNPFESGCLYSKNLTSQKRVCGLDENPLSGKCRPASIEYPEIRLLPSDWESTFFETWILQIALQELLNVPTSIEMGDPFSQMDFYHPDSPMDFPHSNDYKKSLENAAKGNGECSPELRRDGTYQPCGHFNPESWAGTEEDILDMVDRKVIEPPLSLGLIAEEGWFVPRFTAERDPSLLSYFGLRGEQNRKKLAQRFQRPTTWKDYCDIISPNHCLTPDRVARRAPTESEADKMFSEGSYTGFFRPNEKNDCEKNPKCTGFIADYPCGWRSPVPTQLHYLGISLDGDLDSGGYTQSQLLEIWRAANATKSDVIMYWWKQDMIYQDFILSDAEFVPVTMPSATHECMASRPETDHRCSTDPALRLGEPEGTCAIPPRTLHSVMSGTLYNQSHDKRIPEPIQSPSHDALQMFDLSHEQLQEIYALWDSMGDPRQAVCEFVAENMAYLETMVPRTFPRSLEKKEKNGPLFYASCVFGGLTVFLVMATLFAVHKYQSKRAIQYAQVLFLDLTLFGAFLIAIGAVVMGAKASNGSCVAAIWLVNLGYTLELVPLIVKVAGVLHAMQQGKRMQRITIKRAMLLRAVALISGIMVIFLIAWTAVAPPRANPEYELSDSVNEHGETLVWETKVCQSQSQVWSYVAVGWIGALLLVTTVLAFWMRNLPLKGFNEAPTLALVVYTHMFFVVMRVVAYMLRSQVSQYTLDRSLSLIFSADTVATLAIYFLPKLLSNDEKLRRTTRVSISGGVSSLHSTGWYSASSKPLPQKQSSGWGSGPFGLGGSSGKTATNSSRRKSAEDGSSKELSSPGSRNRRAALKPLRLSWWSNLLNDALEREEDGPPELTQMPLEEHNQMEEACDSPDEEAMEDADELHDVDLEGNSAYLREDPEENGNV